MMLEFTQKCKFDADLFTTPPRPKSTAMTTVPTNCLPKSTAEAIKATWTGEGSVVDEGQWRKRFAEGLRSDRSNACRRGISLCNKRSELDSSPKLVGGGDRNRTDE